MTEAERVATAFGLAYELEVRDVARFLTVVNIIENVYEARYADSCGHWDPVKAVVEDDHVTLSLIDMETQEGWAKKFNV